MINIAICDDDNIYSSIILNILEKESQKYALKINFDLYESGEDFLKEFRRNPLKYPIIFLDILMEKMSGIDVSKEIKSLNKASEIIFITSSKEFVFDAYEIGAFNYILKPIDEEKLKNKFNDSLELINKNKKGFTLTKNSDIYYLDINNIPYFEVSGRTIIVNYLNEKIEFYDNLSIIEKKLNYFIRPHRAFLVNPKYIFKISSKELILKDGQVIPISRLKVNRIKSEFLNYIT